MANLKWCYKCNKNRDIEQFSLNKSRKDGRSSQCRICHSKMRKKHYIKNRKKIIEQVSQYKKDLAQFIRDYKTNKPCCDCGNIYPYYVLDFHHKYDKKFSISQAFRAAGKKQLLEEMAKCDLLCANCHRIRTHSGLKRA